MFVILWEFEVKPGSEAGFQNAYSPTGDWVRLFQSDPHFRGTQLLSIPSRSLCFLTLDFWDSEAGYRNFLTANQATYEALDLACAGLTLRERHLASFTL